MSEGWGDFNGLLLQLRDGDNRNGTYAQGSYADASGERDAAYFSVRRFPYSRDRSKNNLSFRHIADENPLPTNTPSRLNGGPNSEVHNAGEVWAMMMFEAFNVLIDAHGVPVARRRITDYSVAGLLLTPPEATFLEGRDAILAAASALDSDDMLVMAAAFAGRGAGSCAIAPTNAVLTNNGVIESGTLAARLVAGAPTLGTVVPGGSGLLRVTLVNSGAVAAEAIHVAVSTTTAGVKLGAPLDIPLLQPFSSVDIVVPVSLAASVPTGAPLAISIRITGEQTCSRDGLTIAFTGTAGGGSTVARLTDQGPPSLLLRHTAVAALYAAPTASLAAADAQVCIASDAP
jgi:hypothetical protein